MRVLLDTNILLYAANRACAENPAAISYLQTLVTQMTPCCLTWPIVYEFFRVATHRRATAPNPLLLPQAMTFIENLALPGNLAFLSPTERHASVLKTLIDEFPHLNGNICHDLHTVVLMREHGVREIATADTDFLQFRFLKVIDPVHRR